MPPQIPSKKFKPDCSEQETHSDTPSRGVGADERRKKRESRRRRAEGERAELTKRVKRQTEIDFQYLTFIGSTQSQVHSLLAVIIYNRRLKGDPDGEWWAIRQCHWRQTALVQLSVVRPTPLNDSRNLFDIVELLLTEGGGMERSTTMASLLCFLIVLNETS